MTIIKHGDIQECVRFVCGNCGCVWKAQEIETNQTYHSDEKRYYMNCPECGEIYVEGKRR